MASTRRLGSEAVSGVRAVLHVKLFHPLNDHYGLSPIEAAASAVDIHNTASRWNKALLDNSARPSGALVYTARDGNLTIEQYDRLKAELEQGFQGAARAGRPLLLEGGLDWKSMSLSPKDMDFIEAKHVAAREIALALGVPPMLLGIPGDNTYSNYQEATRTFWRSTMLPLVNRTAKSLSAWLSPAYGPPPSTSAPTSTPSKPSPPNAKPSWTRIEKSTFLTPNEKRSAVGYGPVAGGDEIKAGSLGSASFANRRADSPPPCGEGLGVGGTPTGRKHDTPPEPQRLSYKYPGQPRDALGQFGFGKDPNDPQPASRGPRPPPRPPRPPRRIGDNRGPPLDPQRPGTGTPPPDPCEPREAIDLYHFVHDMPPSGTTADDHTGGLHRGRRHAFHRDQLHCSRLH